MNHGSGSPLTFRRVSVVAMLASGFAVTGCETEGDGTGGSATTTATTTVSVSSSSGGPIDECDKPSDCPDSGSECVINVCLGHQCGTQNAPFGTPLAAQTDGDCKRAVCDGNGATTSSDDDGDFVPDALECSLDQCANGAVEHPLKAVGSPCSQAGGALCDVAGACVECVDVSDCAPGAVCDVGHCVPPTCTDTVKNGDESDVDCGGAQCAPCALAGICTGSVDCASGLCAAGKCAATTPIIDEVSANGHDRFFNVAVDAQGFIYTVGVSAPGTDTTTDYSTIVAKFNPQGVPDTTFGTNGVFTKNLTVGTNGELARAIGFQSTGKIVVAATVDHVGATDARDRDVAVLRLNTDGTLDTTFGTNGVSILDLGPGQLVGNSYLADSVWHLVVQPDDKIAFTAGQVRPGGTDTDYAMVRLLANGAVDTTFGTNGKVLVDIGNLNASARGLTLLSDGSLLGSGYYDTNGVGAPVVYKVNASGVLDGTFGSGGVFSSPVLAAQTEAYAAAPQGTKLVTTGYGRANATAESLDWLSLRFLANGSLDPTYGQSGVARIDVAGFNDQSRQVIVLPDNRVVLAGGGRPTASNVDGAVGVLTANGQPDVSFAPAGVKLFDLGAANDFLWGMVLSPSKDYLILAGIRGIATGGAGDDDGALVLVPIE